MKLVSKKYTLLMLAGVLAVLMFIMGANLYNRSKSSSSFEQNNEYQEIRSQSRSTEPEAIEEDLMETDLENIDKELQDIEQELEETE